MKTVIITIVAIIVIVGGYFAFFQTPATAPNGNTDVTGQDDAMMEDKDDAMMEDEGSMSGEEGTMPADDSDAMMDDKEDGAMMDDSKTSQNFVIVFDGETYTPSTVNIKKGDTVTWRNDSATETWPASAVHPTHTVYPTTGGCLGSTFDACRGLNQGETFTFQFDEVGTWRFHDHLHSSIFGSVIVAE